MSCKCYGNSNTKILPVISMEMKERIREKLCNECQTILVQLPSDKSWGLIIGDAGKGMLYVVKVKEKSEALKAGIEEGDYIYKFIDEKDDAKLFVNGNRWSVSEIINNYLYVNLKKYTQGSVDRETFLRHYNQLYDKLRKRGITSKTMKTAWKKFEKNYSELETEMENRTRIAWKVFLVKRRSVMSERLKELYYFDDDESFLRELKNRYLDNIDEWKKKFDTKFKINYKYIEKSDIRFQIAKQIFSSTDLLPNSQRVEVSKIYEFSDDDLYDSDTASEEEDNVNDNDDSWLGSIGNSIRKWTGRSVADTHDDSSSSSSSESEDDDE